ncbi:MAG: hypothetical protein HXX15_21120 [Rhodopseudomonas sp.]|uniref:hypothetical protein n=1 Tax=Rhodopseudomonas sp. TaxID=1078 RepID=UPI00181E6F88|nr:hypothetical protein [Rhodopseudomonas sp.]NVN88588.1 hypothetical protein [Rhodopseudomonas sp.]
MSKHVPPPTGEPLDSLSLEAALGKREAETLLSDLPRLRKEASRQIEFLIALLDATEPDPDLEPSLGSGRDGGDDREMESEHDEPSLCGVTVRTDLSAGEAKPISAASTA